MPVLTNILITGATGFVGRHLCKALSTRGLRLSCLSRTSVKSNQDKLDFYNLDLLDKAEVRRLIFELQPDCVVHLAASKYRGDELLEFRTTYESNLYSAWNVIDACQDLPNFKRFIFLGSCDEYGRVCPPYRETQKAVPASAYGLSKFAITQVLETLHSNYNFPMVVLRPSVIYGPGQGHEMFIPALIKALMAGQSFPMTQGWQSRDFLYISDVVDAMVKAIYADECINGEVINLGAGKSYVVRTVVEMVLREIPEALSELVNFGALPYRSFEEMQYAVSINRAAKLLGWYPQMDLQQGLRNTILHFAQTKYGSS